MRITAWDGDTIKQSHVYLNGVKQHNVTMADDEKGVVHTLTVGPSCDRFSSQADYGTVQIETFLRSVSKPTAS